MNNQLPTILLEGADRDENDLEVEEHFNLGKERLCQIQSMFSNSPGNSQQDQSREARDRMADIDSPLGEISELKMEGLVSSNLSRFQSGNIVGSTSSSHIPAKLLETNNLDKGHIEAVSQKVSFTLYLIQLLNNKTNQEALELFCHDMV